jgi:BON domain
MKARIFPRGRMALLIGVVTVAVACAKPANDGQITSDVQTRLSADSGLQGKQLSVQSDKGTVTLSGMVDNDAQREAAAKYAASEPGVKTVINNLQVGTHQVSAEPEREPVPEPTPSREAPSSRKKAKPSPSRRHGYQSSESNDQMAQGGPPPAMNSAPPRSQDPAPAPVQQPAATPPPPPEPAKVTVPSGAVIPVRLVDAIDSATAQAGDTFHATLDAPVAVDGDVVIPAHYDVEGHVVNAQASGKFAGRALLELQLDRIKVGEKYYNIETDHFKQETGSRGKNTAAKVGGGAVAGAILGGIFGGGKGAAIGSVAGAGAGGGVQAASKKPDIKLSSEKILTFTLQSPVTIVPTTKPARVAASTNQQ